MNNQIKSAFEGGFESLKDEAIFSYLAYFYLIFVTYLLLSFVE